jgi:hypothetical protein
LLIGFVDEIGYKEELRLEKTFRIDYFDFRIGGRHDDDSR